MNSDDFTNPENDVPPEGDLRALEIRLARLESQVFAHSERIAEFDAAARARQRRALWIRLILLGLALVAFFAIKMWGPGSAG